MATTIQIKTLFNADGKQLAKTITTTEKQLTKVTNGALKTFIGQIASAFAFRQIQMFATETTKMAAEFDQSMRNVNTIAKQTEAQFQNTKSAVMSLAVELGSEPTGLANALYNINSAGFQGAEGLEILRQATTNAIGGMTSTEIAAKGLTTVLNSYSMGVESAEDVSDILFQTVNKGVLTYEELATSIGTVIPTAAAAGIAFDEIGAAIAAATKQGIDAEKTMVGLNGLILQLVKPTDALTEAWLKEKNVLPSVTLSTEGFVSSLRTLSKMAGDNTVAMSEMINEKRAMRLAFALTGESAATFEDAINAIVDAMERAGASYDAFEEADKGLGRSLGKSEARLNAWKISIGKFTADVFVGIQDTFEGFANIIYGVESDAEIKARKDHEEWMKEHSDSGKQMAADKKMWADAEAEDLKFINMLKEKQDELDGLIAENAEDRETSTDKLARKQKIINDLVEANKELAIDTNSTIEDQVEYTSNLVEIERQSKDIEKLILKAKKEQVAASKDEADALKELIALRGDIDEQEREKLSTSEQIEDINNRINGLNQQALLIGIGTTEQLTEHARIQKEINDLKKEREGLLEKEADEHNKVTEAMDAQKESAKELKDGIDDIAKAGKDVSIDIDVPHISEALKDRYIKLITKVDGMRVGAKIDVNVPHISDALVDRYIKLLKAINGVVATVDVGSLDEATLTRYKELVKEINSIQQFVVNIPENITHEVNVNLNIPAQYRNGIPIDTSALQEIGLDRIANNLEILAKLKGLIWI